MKKGFLVMAVVVIIALYILNKVNTARQLEFTLGLPKNISLQSGDVTFILPLRCQNVTSTALRVKGLDFDLNTAGQTIGKAILTEGVTIQPSGYTIINVAVSIPLLSLIMAGKSIVNLFKSGKVNIGIDGLVYAEGFQVPYSNTFELDYKSVL